MVNKGATVERFFLHFCRNKQISQSNTHFGISDTYTDTLQIWPSNPSGNSIIQQVLPDDPSLSVLSIFSGICFLVVIINLPLLAMFYYVYFNISGMLAYYQAISIFFPVVLPTCLFLSLTLLFSNHAQIFQMHTLTFSLFLFCK